MYEIVRYDPGLKEQIARLQRHLWSGGVRLNTAYFEWKYEENPFIKVPLLHLALGAGRVIGMRGMFGSCWEVGSPSRRVLVPCADDFVIDPEHRNHGIGGAIMRAAVEDAALSDYEYAFSLSAGPVTLAAVLVAGWRAVGSMRPARRTSAGARFINRMAARLRTAPVLWRYGDPLVRAHHRGVGGGRFGPSIDGPGGPVGDRGRRCGWRRHLGQTRWRTPSRSSGATAASATSGTRPTCSGATGTRCTSIGSWFRRRIDCAAISSFKRTARSQSAESGSSTGKRRRPRSGWICSAPHWSGGRFPELIVWTATLPSETDGPLTALWFVPARSGSPLRGVATTMIRPVGRAPAGADPILEGQRLLDLASWDMRMIYSMAG